ncbi:uncharacterized protein N7515_008012 [Penicillium bovifimosum]|uniref:RRM domain-containing protein n=1 Tax=Penicillium bovifimosum TaxID=126998 RepID=A0A9W9GNB2_9EURO|nr:uncharacterized protein N7515_008012 [Penicillium bovifimosum]KAJ5124187.1 hypothetical protein N7515_008012 [Penicillium bovifimosum]
MATDEDNFDIDIYGDGTYNANEPADFKHEDAELLLDASDVPQTNAAGATNANNQSDNVKEEKPAPADNQPAATDGAQEAPQQQPNGLPAVQQGTKRKEPEGVQSERDANATSALMITDLNWWNNEEDIRAWTNHAGVETELKEVTFSEHKVNGKSKGQAFVLFTTAQAAAAARRSIESIPNNGQGHAVHYTNAHQNPFRTLPKDNPARGAAGRTGSGPHTGGNNYNANAGGGSFRGRGGYNNRGGMGGNYNARGNFGGGMGGYQGVPNPMMGGFQGPAMGGMQNFNFNANRGGMMGGMRGGMRGGRGGAMGPGGMMGMPAMPAMGGMGMNAMPGMGMMGAGMGNMAGAGMGGMGAGMGNMNPAMGNMGNMRPGMGANMQPQGQHGYQGAGQPFTPANFYNNNANQGRPNSQSGPSNQGGPNNQGQGAGADGSWNPHGAKRSRQT